MLSFKEILEIIEQEIAGLNHEQNPKGLFSPMKYILSLGGKRIRPALTLIACNIFNENVSPSVHLALGLEVFHNFTLLHDDLMDRAEIRRGKPTVHKKWNENTAILSGDAMLIIAYQIISKVEEKNLSRYLGIFSEMALRICKGQQYDMEFESRLNVSENEYIQMITDKTAVLIASALQLGALAGGATEEQAALLYQYGIHIGLAFQLKDDYLDTYGNREAFGKKIGGDILCNKKTYLLIQALKKADSSRSAELKYWLEMDECDPEEKIVCVRAIYNELSIPSICEQKINHHYECAQKYLSRLDIQKNRLHVLNEVSDMLMFRKA